MIQRTDSNVVRLQGPPCTDCLGWCDRRIPGPLCGRCVAARRLEAVTELWSPEDRQGLERVFTLVEQVTPADDVGMFWRFCAEIAELRNP